jgi:tRNA A-37 threonylcarbamoyl transferase component Bud32
MICPACHAKNDDEAEACFTCGRALAALTRGHLIDGRYEVLRPLGKGGMGMVYEAHDRMLDESVAIKVLRAEFANTPQMAARFRHEIKLARRVSHRNVCRIHEYGEDQGVRYISMEFVQGTDLRRLLHERGGYLEVGEALDVVIQAADGLGAIHEVGIVHRDLKATNIMRDGRGLVRLMDFGIAKIEGTDPDVGAALTTTGQVMGTPEYMSPEQCFGEKIDHRSDLYSLGIVLYELLTGTVPFRGETAVATLLQQIQDAAPLSGPATQRLPEPIVPVLDRTLQKSRTERFPTAAAMAEALREAYREIAFAAASAERRSAHGEAASDRRGVTRLDIVVNFVLRRVGTLGTVLQEERTIAENVGRGGARVMTTISSLAPGDVVQVEEVGGRFKTRAEVRGSFLGRDRIRRLNLRFLDHEAPDYLVHVDAPG